MNQNVKYEFIHKLELPALNYSKRILIILVRLQFENSEYVYIKLRRKQITKLLCFWYVY